MFKRKLSPKGVKMCAGCPPKVIEPITAPKFTFTPPVKEESTRVVNIVNMSKFKKKTNSDNSLF